MDTDDTAGMGCPECGADILDPVPLDPPTSIIASYECPYCAHVWRTRIKGCVEFIDWGVSPELLEYDPAMPRA